MSSLEDQLQKLGVIVEELTTSDNWMKWLKVAKRFHKYSYGNQILIMIQNPEATQVAGFRAWQKMGRQVRKGEHGIRILAPMRFKAKELADGEPNARGNRSRVLFTTVAVFDVKQTDLFDESLWTEQPEWPLLDANDNGIFQELILRVLPQTSLTFEDFEGSLDGKRAFYNPTESKLAVRRDLLDTVTGSAAVLHELAHYFDHQLGWLDPDVYAEHRPEAELVAESVAWVMCQRIGLAVDNEVQFYLASWNATPATIMQAGKRIAAIGQAIETLWENAHSETEADVA